MCVRVIEERSQERERDNSETQRERVNSGKTPDKKAKVEEKRCELKVRQNGKRGCERLRDKKLSKKKVEVNGCKEGEGRIGKMRTEREKLGSDRWPGAEKVEEKRGKEQGKRGRGKRSIEQRERFKGSRVEEIKVVGETGETGSRSTRECRMRERGKWKGEVEDCKPTRVEGGEEGWKRNMGREIERATRVEYRGEKRRRRGTCTGRWAEEGGVSTGQVSRETEECEPRVDGKCAREECRKGGGAEKWKSSKRDQRQHEENVRKGGKEKGSEVRVAKPCRTHCVEIGSKGSCKDRGRQRKLGVKEEEEGVVRKKVRSGGLEAGKCTTESRVRGRAQLQEQREVGSDVVEHIRGRKDTEERSVTRKGRRAEEARTERTDREQLGECGGGHEGAKREREVDREIRGMQNKECTRVRESRYWKYNGGNEGGAERALSRRKIAIERVETRQVRKLRKEGGVRWRSKRVDRVRRRRKGSRKERHGWEVEVARRGKKRELTERKEKSKKEDGVNGGRTEKEKTGSARCMKARREERRRRRRREGSKFDREGREHRKKRQKGRNDRNSKRVGGEKIRTKRKGKAGWTRAHKPGISREEEEGRKRVILRRQIEGVEVRRQVQRRWERDKREVKRVQNAEELWKKKNAEEMTRSWSGESGMVREEQYGEEGRRANSYGGTRGEDAQGLRRNAPDSISTGKGERSAGITRKGECRVEEEASENEGQGRVRVRETEVRVGELDWESGSGEFEVGFARVAKSTRAGARRSLARKDANRKKRRGKKLAGQGEWAGGETEAIRVRQGELETEEAQRR
ncbi:hypothetical protein Tco_1327813 [Tanacetum coccineum]